MLATAPGFASPAIAPGPWPTAPAGRPASPHPSFCAPALWPAPPAPAAAASCPSPAAGLRPHAAATAIRTQRIAAADRLDGRRVLFMARAGGYHTVRWPAT